MDYKRQKYVSILSISLDTQGGRVVQWCLENFPVPGRPTNLD